MDIFSAILTFASPQVLLNSLVAASLYALVAASFSFIWGATKFFNLSHGVVAAVGGYTVLLLSRFLGWPIWSGVVVGIIVAGLVGYAADRLVFSTLRRRHASNTVLLVASLGIFVMLQAVLAMLFGNQFYTLSVASSRTYSIFGGVVTPLQIFMGACAVVVPLLLALVLRTTRWGKAIRAVSDDEEVAKIVGINTDRVIGWVFAVGSAIAGLAGALVGFDTGIEPVMGLPLLLKGIIAAIIGGLGSLPGAVLGAVLVGIAENFGALLTASEWKDAIAFGLLIAFLIFRPRGIIVR